MNPHDSVVRPRAYARLIYITCGLLLATMLVACGGGGGADGTTGTAPPPATPPPAPTAVAWTAYVGAHYGARSWAQSVRDPGGPGRTGFDPAVAPATSLASFNAFLASNVAPLLPAHYLVFGVGGLGSGRDQTPVDNFMNFIKNGNVATYRQALKDRAKAMAALSDAPAKVSWQFGNEINSQIFSETLHTWAQDGVTPRGNDTSTIPFIVEYFLAPGVEGIEQASLDLFGNRDGIRIMLGSVSSATNPNAQAFLSELLDYQILGTYAPSLAGKRVYQIVDTISIHYAVGTGSGVWRTFLDGLHNGRVGQGKIQRIVSTEEVGQRAANAGEGMGTAVHVLARYFDWWIGRGYTPDRGHVYLWGTDLGPAGNTIDALMPVLHNFLGEVGLVKPAATAAVSGAANLEHYEFESAQARRRVLAVFAADGATTSLANITAEVPGWNTLNVSVHHFTANGNLAVTPTVSSLAAGRFAIGFGSLTINPREALLILLRE